MDTHAKQLCFLEYADRILFGLGLGRGKNRVKMCFSVYFENMPCSDIVSCCEDENVCFSKWNLLYP